ncbi:hypothetical protein BVRB_022650 [Beta vulgaris subsp. vulgaris]|uniref:Uncharacterized protein n=1 Tax=Beta vulgaris subsp. vulgaris TaxID=3555 RepID=A0A0J8AZW9_BETVV|nr:hypothetical protein BVRB_022650 [Beta vulgaris subsp. vulgaris]
MSAERSSRQGTPRPSSTRITSPTVIPPLLMVCNVPSALTDLNTRLHGCRVPGVWSQISRPVAMGRSALTCSNRLIGRNVSSVYFEVWMTFEGNSFGAFSARLLTESALVGALGFSFRNSVDDGKSGTDNANAGDGGGERAADSGPFMTADQNRIWAFL